MSKLVVNTGLGLRAGPRPGSRRIIGLMLLLAVPLGLAAETALVPPTGLVASLEDEVRTLEEGRITWSIYWKLCWQPYPGAQHYELQTLTAEGSSPKLHPHHDTCFRIQAAAGEDATAQAPLNRDALLALQAGQLAYRVRAVLKDERVSAWSTPIAVGELTR